MEEGPFLCLPGVRASFIVRFGERMSFFKPLEGISVQTIVTFGQGAELQGVKRDTDSPIPITKSLFSFFLFKAPFPPLGMFLPESESS